MILNLKNAHKSSLLLFLLTLIFLMGLGPDLTAKEKKKGDKDPAIEKSDSSIYKGLKWRSIGPAFKSGRIADFAVNPDNHSEWYVAVASGNVWKTVNNGTTFKPIFENKG